MDKFRAMQTFVRIAEAGSLTAAAPALGCSLPAVVRALAAYERALGVRLFHRTTRRISLTDEGRQHLERSRHVLAALAEAEAALSAGAETPTGRLHITAPVLFGQMYVAPVVTRFVPPETTEEARLDVAKGARPGRPRPEAGGVTVKGLDDILVRFAKCCGPVPGDPIVGFITRGRGIPVHARDCPNLAAGAVDSDRTVAVEWAAADQ